MWTITTTGGIFEGKYLSTIAYDTCYKVKVDKIRTVTGAWKEHEYDMLLETPRPEGGCRRILVHSEHIVAIELTDDGEDEEDE